MRDKIMNILLQKAAHQELANFYILRAPQMVSNPDTYLETWMENFLIEFIAQEKGCDQTLARNTYNFDVADILQLHKQTDKTKYVVEDLEQLFQFVELYPLEFKTKLVIFYTAHFIETTVANKLLKLLEEPTNQTTIFFLYGTRTEAIKTIESRAIKLSLPAPSLPSTPPVDIMQLLQQSHTKIAPLLAQYLQDEVYLANLLDKLYKHKEQEIELIKLLTDCFRFYSKNYSHSAHAVEILQEYEQQKQMNLPMRSRIFPLLTHFKQHYDLSV